MIFIEFNYRGNKDPRKLVYFVGKSAEAILRDARKFGSYASYRTVPRQEIFDLGIRSRKCGVDFVRKGKPSFFLGTSRGARIRTEIVHTHKLKG